VWRRGENVKMAKMEEERVSPQKRGKMGENEQKSAKLGKGTVETGQSRSEFWDLRTPLQGETRVREN
jgi:hypothetical protein